MKRYYFSDADLSIEALKNKTFTLSELENIFQTYFENELKETGDTETTFKSWLYDNLKMNLIVEINEDAIVIPKRYSQTYVSCLPVELEAEIVSKVLNNYGYLVEDDLFEMLDNVEGEKVTNITDTIEIRFEHI